METAERVLPPNPRDQAKLLSIIFFTWTIPFLKKGYRKVLELNDIFRVLNDDRSDLLGDRLEQNWKSELSKSNRCPSLLRAISKTFYHDYLKVAFLAIINDAILRVIQPYFLGKLLLYFREDKIETRMEAIIYSTAIIVVNFLFTITFAHLLLMCFHTGMRLRVATCSLIYRKAMRLSHRALNETSIGKMVNLLSNDVRRFDQIATSLNAFWIGPLLTIIISILVWNEIRWAGMIGIAVIIIIVPLHSYSGKLSAKFRLQTALQTDERIRFMSEIIYGIQTIKLFSWEFPFSNAISQIRTHELNVIRKNSFIRAIFMALMLFTTRIAIFSTMLSIALLYGSNQITAAKVFSVSSYFNILATASMQFLRSITEIVEVMVAFLRLEHFFTLNEKVANLLINIPKKSSNDEHVSISLKCASAHWNDGSALDCGTFTLKNLNLNLPNGKLIGVIGSVGAGKTTLLQVILNELPLACGSINVNGTVSYASQEPWIFAASIRQNILFGEKYDRERYNTVVNSCALAKDFQQFAMGDRTLIGDRGASLSGGQKARVNLARALYRVVDIILLDDPLSAVDAHVGTHIFNNCIGPLSPWAKMGSTRILVTHQVHFLKEADWIVILENGQIKAQNSPKNLIESGIDLINFIKSDFENVEKTNESATDTNLNQSLKSIEKCNQNIDVNDQLEASSKGTVEGSIFLKYFKCGTNQIAMIFIFASFILVQFLASAADYWVSIWTRQEEMRLYQRNDTSHTIKLEPLSTSFCIWIHSILLGSLFIFAIVRSIGFYINRINASQKLHDSMLRSVMSSTMQFFNSNPSGRILNRFSKDIGAIDELLPKAIMDASQLLLVIMASIVVTILVNPLFLLPTIIIGIVFSFIRKVYLKTSNNVKRLEGITKSPLFTHLNTTLTGLTVVRALKAEKILQKEFDNHQDAHTACYYMFIATSRAFGLSLDLFCCIFVASVIYVCVFVEIGLTGDQVGLAITQSISLLGLLQWGIRSTADISNQMPAVERIFEYQQLESEKEPEHPKKLPDNWPSNGCIQFQNVSYRYSPKGERILRGLSFIIKSKQKIGIVGRTGAGKSSLIGALFRLDNVEGKIVIDDIDTSTITLKDLRSRIAIITQDPVLFSGTLRGNLDPFDEYSDADLWQALQEVELGNIASTSLGLSTKVLSHGCNFSVGQRQLICLARAILRKNRILVLDEATANVDPETDHLIQRKIREKFSNCTVLTVAHRLHTIMDSDLILVMDNGRIIEFGEPHCLLQNETNIFTSMVKVLGPTEYERLSSIAFEKYNSKAVDA